MVATRKRNYSSPVATRTTKRTKKNTKEASSRAPPPPPPLPKKASPRAPPPPPPLPQLKSVAKAAAPLSFAPGFMQELTGRLAAMQATKKRKASVSGVGKTVPQPKKLMLQTNRGRGGMTFLDELKMATSKRRQPSPQATSMRALMAKTAAQRRRYVGASSSSSRSKSLSKSKSKSKSTKSNSKAKSPPSKRTGRASPPKVNPALRSALMGDLKNSFAFKKRARTSPQGNVTNKTRTVGKLNINTGKGGGDFRKELFSVVTARRLIE